MMRENRARLRSACRERSETIAMPRTKNQPVALTVTLSGPIRTRPCSARFSSCASSTAKYCRKSISQACSIGSNSNPPRPLPGLNPPPPPRQTPLVQKVVILVQRLGVLAVAGAHAANGRNPQADQVAVRLRAVALEIAMQPPLPLGHGQRV